MRHCFNVILISGKVPALSAPGLVVYCYAADMWRDVELQPHLAVGEGIDI